MGIVVIGATFVDIKGYPSSNYIPGGRNAGRVEIVHGGVCRNIAEDIANVELRPTFVSLVDETAAGAEVVEKLERHRVNTRFIRRIPDGMGTWLAVFDNTGDVVASISKRPDLTEVGAILDEQGDEIFRDADGIVIEIDMDKSLIKRILKYAEKYDIPIFGAVSNMSIAVERRDFVQHINCLVCNQQEAGLFFMEDLDACTPEEIAQILPQRIQAAGISRMIVTMGAAGAVYAEAGGGADAGGGAAVGVERSASGGRLAVGGDAGIVPAQKVNVVDTTGAGDAFIAGVSIGLTHGKTLREACAIGTRLSASVIGTKESVCPRFRKEEFGL